MLTEKDYCDYDTCVALIEMGFVGISRYYYDKKNHNLHLTNCGITYTVHTASALDYVLAINLYNAHKWLREEKRIEVVILGENEIGGPYYADVYDSDGYAGWTHKSYKKYEEALLRGIKIAVELLKEEK